MATKEHANLSLSASFHRAEGEKEKEEEAQQRREAEQPSKATAKSGFRACPQHNSEKLTLYAARARCFGCVKCFQEGVLRGHQGQSLQRAHEEVKEKLLRQHGTLLQQSRTVKENLQVNSAAEKLIEQERAAVQANVKRGVENVKADLTLKSAQLAKAVEEWRQTKLSGVEAAAELLKTEIQKIDGDMTLLKGWYADDDDVLLETFYKTRLDRMRDGEEERAAALATCQKNVVPRIENSHALKSCGSMSFFDDDFEESSAQFSSSGPASGPRRDMSDAAELDRVAVIALGSTEIDKLSPQDRLLFWKHRVTLTDKKKALLKLLKCAQWDKERQGGNSQTSAL